MSPSGGAINMDIRTGFSRHKGNNKKGDHYLIIDIILILFCTKLTDRQTASSYPYDRYHCVEGLGDGY